MATPIKPIIDGSPVLLDPETHWPFDWYPHPPRTGQGMVTIVDQTVEDYIRRCPEGWTCEYIDGVVYMPAAVDAQHQFNIQWLSAIFELFNQDRQVGIILTGPAALRVSPTRYLEPDLFVLPFGGKAQIHGWYSIPPVPLVVEVLSPSTRTYDLTHKIQVYREANVPEAWFIDNRDRTVTVDRWTPEGYLSERLEKGRLISRSIPGFWFSVEWLWEQPRPNILRCLEQIMAGPPF